MGCVGLITHAEPLPDGRFNIVLQGVERFRVIGEDHSRVYRLGRIERLGGDCDARRSGDACRGCAIGSKR